MVTFEQSDDPNGDVTPLPLNPNRRSVRSSRGKNDEDLQKPSALTPQAEQRRIDRRSKTMSTMGISKSVKAALGEAMSGLVDGVANDSTPTEKLNGIMIAAKQTGMSTDKIFSFFKGTTKDGTEITMEEFEAALKGLSPTLFDLSDGEIKDLVNLFDMDGDGMVSNAEFKNYCYYKIPAVCWKAERMRMEKAGEIREIKHENEEGKKVLNPLMSPNQMEQRSMDINPNNITVPLGEKFYEGNKLYWRNDTTLHNRMYFNKDLNLICLSCWNEEKDHQFLPIFIDGSKIPLDKKAIDERTAKGELEYGVRMDMLANYILARLKIPDASNPFPKEELGRRLPPLSPRSEAIMPFIVMLSEDLHNIMIPAPKNATHPVRYEKLEHVDLDKFSSLLDEMKEHTKDMRRMATSADRMQQLTSIAMHAFGQAEKETIMRKKMTASQKKWFLVMTRWLVGQQVVSVQEVLDASPTYQKMRDEQEIKRAAAAAAGGEAGEVMTKFPLVKDHGVGTLVPTDSPASSPMKPAQKKA